MESQWIAMAGVEYDSDDYEIEGIYNLLSREFLDWFNDCSGSSYVEYKSCKGLSNLDKKKLFITPDNVSGCEHLLMSAFKHFYHQLPNFGLSEKAESLLKEGHWEYSNGDMKFMLTRSIMLSYVQALPIVKDISSKLLNGKKWIGYIVHNHNIVGLMVMLIGKHKATEYYYPHYATTVELLVRRNSEGEVYVTLIKDGNKVPMMDCELNCPVADFENILTNLIDEEDNVVKFCESGDQEFEF
jgi:hypothetical protein